MSHAVGEYNNTYGHNSFAYGSNLQTDTFLTFAIGQYNESETVPEPDAYLPTNTAFVIGNGKEDSERSNAFKVLFDGTTSISGVLTATQFIGDGSQLTNLPETPSSGLEELTENGSTGWRLLDADPANYGDIGSEAVDLSVASVATDNYGAMGVNSFAAGRHVKASGGSSVAIGSGARAEGTVSFASGINTYANGYASVAMGGYSETGGAYSFAIGDSTTTYGLGSVAMGKDTQATSNYSFAVGHDSNASGVASNAFGIGTIAESFGTTVIGQYNAPSVSPNPGTFLDTNMAFAIGNGTSDTTRSNAFEVLFNGDTNVRGDVTVNGELDAYSFVGDGSGLTNTPDEQDLTSATLSGTRLTIAIENGASVEVDLAPLLTDILSRLTTLENCACDGTLSTSSTDTILMDTHLLNIHPNPTQQKVSIDYYVPQASHSAKLRISNALGQNISEFRLTKKGKQTITFNVKDMPTGIYFCTLSVDGHRTTARRMIVQ